MQVLNCAGHQIPAGTRLTGQLVRSPGSRADRPGGQRKTVPFPSLATDNQVSPVCCNQTTPRKADVSVAADIPGMSGFWCWSCRDSHGGHRFDGTVFSHKANWTDEVDTGQCTSLFRVCWGRHKLSLNKNMSLDEKKNGVRVPTVTSGSLN